MTDLLALGASGVRAYQSALSVVGDNVANADTPGYVRRNVVLKAGPGVGVGDPLTRSVSSGSGVVTDRIARAYDALKTNAVRNADGDLARLTTRSDWLTQLQSALGSGDASLTARIASFFNAASDLASQPTSTAARTVFLDRADQAAGQFRTTAAALDNLAGNLKTATQTATDEVNQTTAGIAAVNAQLARSPAGGSAANGLLDTRDALLGKLATLVRIAVSETANGSVEVRLGDAGNGALLVKGDSATRIAVADSASGPVLVLGPTHNPVTVRLPASGTLSGLIESARKIGDAHAAIDLLATRFASAVNAQHRDGVDAGGNDGTALFATRTLTIAAGAANGGVALLGIDLADQGVIDASGYTMSYLGGQWTLARGDASASTAGPGPLTLDGVTVTANGAAHEGDHYTLAAADGAAGLSARPLAPGALAVSARWLTDAAAGNTGSGSLDARGDPVAAGLPPLPAYRIDITAPGSADVYDPATNTLLASVALNGWLPGAGFDFNLSGTPAVGDSFRVTRATAGGSDNGNLRAILAIRDAQGGDGTLEQALDATTAGVASNLAETKRLGEAAQAVASDAARVADGITGVDLDAEATQLVQLQAAYKASSQIIAAARDLFDTLLQAAR
jgi:flagellar hook-associated protein 1 FlgK